MELDVVCGDAVLVLRVMQPRIDAAVAVEFKDRMRAAAACPAPRVILDLAQVDFMDSSGLGAVVAGLKLLAPARRLELAALSPMVEKVFRLTRMDSIFVIHRDLAAAIGDPDVCAVSCGVPPAVAGAAHV